MAASSRGACGGLPWWLTFLCALLVAATAVFSAYVKKERNELKTIFDVLDAKTSAARAVTDSLVWLTVVAWVGVVVAGLGVVATGIIKSVSSANRGHFRDNKGSPNPVPRTCAAFFTSRVLLDLIVGTTYISCIVCVLIIIVQVLIIVSFKVVNVLAKAANPALQAGLTVATSDAFKQGVAQVESQLQSAIDTLNKVCSAGGGGAVAASECSSSLQNLQSASDAVNKFAPVVDASGRCPSQCLDIHNLWFVQQGYSNTTCICDSTVLTQIETASNDGFHASLVAAIAIFVAFLLWLLFFCKVSQNVKGFLKDRRWMAIMSGGGICEGAPRAPAPAPEYAPNYAQYDSNRAAPPPHTYPPAVQSSDYVEWSPYRNVSSVSNKDGVEAANHGYADADADALSMPTDDSIQLTPYRGAASPRRGYQPRGTAFV